MKFGSSRRSGAHSCIQVQLSAISEKDGEHFDMITTTPLVFALNFVVDTGRRKQKRKHKKNEKVPFTVLHVAYRDA